MSKGIQDYVNQLPERSYTVRMLQALDWVVPGQWQNVVGFENLADLHLLPPRGAYVVALPMKIEGGSGGPLRIVAFVPNGLPE